MKKKENQEVVRFVGLSLAGGKTDKACLSILEYYPKGKRIFLSRVFEKIKSEPQISADLKIHELIEQYTGSLEFLAVDVPWTMPLCLTCKLKCPGYESCTVPHIEWMWRHNKEEVVKKKPKKLFTPYTQRAVEMYLHTELEEVFNLPHAMGSNSAPLVARAAFLRRRLPKVNFVEVYPKLSIWRVGRSFQMMKSHLTTHRHSVEGPNSRRILLQELNNRNLAFLYEQDQKLLVENSHAFDSFICAFTAYLKYVGQTEKRPSGFPKSEGWIEFPLSRIHW